MEEAFLGLLLRASGGCGGQAGGMSGYSLSARRKHFERERSCEYLTAQHASLEALGALATL